MLLGFLVLLYLCETTGFSAQALDLSAFLGGKRDQNILLCPEYPAGFAGYITLGLIKANMHRVEFSRPQAFLLEGGNLQRMLGILHGAYDKEPYESTYDITLLSGKKIKFDSPEDLLRHDNTLADPIHHLTVTTMAKEGDFQCEIYFYGEKKPDLSGVTVRVESSEQRWASSLAAELEEQVDRIKMLGPIYQLRQSVGVRNLLSAFLVPIITVLIMFGLFMDLSQLSGVQNERQVLLKLAESARTTDEKVDFLVRAQIAALRERNPESLTKAFKVPTLDGKTVAGAVPALVALVILFYLLKYCYPPAVFSWGDSGKHFQRLLERRKNLWSILFTAIALGFVVNVSSPVISNWLGV